MESRCPYELMELIGQGNMGQVFLARHTGLDRMEALKVLVPSLERDNQFVSRLRREAKAASMLTHPHIVSVYGFGRLQDGRYYLAMEYLVGQSLDVFTGSRGALPEALTIRLLYQLASAMAQAHRQSVVHRDIKPANLMLVDLDGTAPNLKMLDFGLAKIISPDYDDSQKISQSGTVMGTPGYMAPERSYGVETAPTIDIYSFGCVAYALMTGRPPFVGAVQDVLYAHRNELPVPPRKRAPGNAALETIVMNCLAKDPDKRYPDGAMLREAFGAIHSFVGEDTKEGTRSPVAAEESSEPTTLRRQRFPVVRTVVDRPESPPTAFAEGGEGFGAIHRYQRQLLSLGEEFGVLGAGGPALQDCMARIRKTSDLLDEHEETRRSLQAQGDRLYQDFRHTEAQLRFELGEVSFAISEGGSAEELRVADTRLNQLTEDLVRAEYAHDRELQNIVEREVDLTALRYGIEETQRKNWNELVALVAAELATGVSTEESRARRKVFEEARRELERLTQEQRRGPLS